MTCVIAIVWPILLLVVFVALAAAVRHRWLVMRFRI